MPNKSVLALFHMSYTVESVFCNQCEAILPIAEVAPCMIACVICCAERYFSVPSSGLKLDSQERAFQRAATDLDYAELATQDEVIQVEHICEKCGHHLASYTTQQTRSADEGQTVFYTCLKCKHRCIEYS